MKNAINNKIATVKYPFMFVTFLTLALSLLCLTLKAESPNQNVQLQDIFSKSETKILKIDLEQFQKKAGEINYTINLGRYGCHQLVLEENDLLSDHLRQKIEQQSSKDKANVAQSYLGKIANQPNSKVALTVNHNFISGFIEYNETSIYFEPLYNFDKHAKINEIVIYNKNDVKTKVAGCTHNHEPNSLKVAQQTRHLKKSAANCSDFTVEIYLVADYEIFEKYGTTQKVKDRMQAVLNGVEANFATGFNHPINFKIWGHYIPDSATKNLWSLTETSAARIVAKFAENDLTDKTYDLATLWVNRDFWALDENGQVKDANGYASGLVCNRGHKYNVIKDNRNTLSSLQITHTHEIGHNFGVSIHDSEANYTMSSPSGPGGWSDTSIEVINEFYPNTNCLCNIEFVDLEVRGNCFQVSSGNGIESYTVSIYNTGNIASTETTVGLFISEDYAVTTDDILVKMFPLDVLNSDQFTCKTMDVDFSNIELSNGTYFYAFIVDAEDEIDERNEDNNLSYTFTESFGITSIVGDVNVDGSVNILDATNVARLAVGLKTSGMDCVSLTSSELCFEQADMNRDGNVNIQDAYEIAKCVVGLSKYCSPD